MLKPASPLFALALSLGAMLSLSGCAGDPFAAAQGVVTSVAEAVSMPGEGLGETPVHVASHESWGEPQMVPVGFRGPQAVADTDGPYLLDSGDKLRVFVYGQPNLSRSYTVDHDGNITIPLINTIKARGHTTQALEHIIRRALAADFVRDPQVTVDVSQNRPFFILGEVKNSGQYPYVSGMTIETAIAIAGGYSERASTRKFRLSRRINGFVEQIEAPSDYVVQPGDTVFVYERFL